MASGFYSKGKQGILDGSINLETDTIKVVLIDDSNYTPNFSTDDNYDDVPSGARVGTPQTLTSKTFTDGVFNAASPLTFTAVTGPSVESALYFKDTGVESTSRLICMCALAAARTPNGGDIEYSHDSGTNKIFKL